jgi:hypothetical protein
MLGFDRSLSFGFNKVVALRFETISYNEVVVVHCSARSVHFLPHSGSTVEGSPSHPYHGCEAADASTH